MNLTPPQTGLDSVTAPVPRRRCVRRPSLFRPVELRVTQTRRHWLSVVLLGLAVSFANGEPVAARPADAFVDSIGVNTHFNYRNTAYYQRFEECKKAILDADIRHVRGRAVNEKTSADVIKLQKSLAENRAVDEEVTKIQQDAGIRWWLEAIKKAYGAWKLPHQNRGS